MKQQQNAQMTQSSSTNGFVGFLQKTWGFVKGLPSMAWAGAKWIYEIIKKVIVATWTGITTFYQAIKAILKISESLDKKQNGSCSANGNGASSQGSK